MTFYKVLTLLNIKGSKKNSYGKRNTESNTNKTNNEVSILFLHNS